MSHSLPPMDCSTTGSSVLHYLSEFAQIHVPWIALISQDSKVMFKILQSKLQLYMNCEILDIQAGFRKGRGTRDQIANIHWIIKKVRSSRKTSTSDLLAMPKPLTVWITINQPWKILKKWEYQITWPAFWEICIQVNKHSENWTWTTDWFQIRKGVHQGCILSPCLFTLYAEYIMRNAGLDKAQAGIKIVGRNINNLRYADDTPLWQNVQKN